MVLLMSVNVHVGELDRVHSAGQITNNTVIVGGKHFCCLLDTGAQVSLVNVGVLNQFSLADIVIHDCDNSLVGLGNDETKVGGYANLKLNCMILILRLHIHLP